MSEDTIPEMTPDEVQAASTAGEVQVIDVRPSFDYAGERIPHATSLPNRSLATRTEQLDTDKRLVFVCEDGAKSVEAAELARSLGFTDVAVLGGGFDAWLDAGLPTHNIDDGT